ncbi:MAG: hypothetical protein CMB20_003655 [Methanobacteriota archaeon]|nr:MAG: hypothetical protein CMB20_003655 [Euryarchaeota archaeon]
MKYAAVQGISSGCELLSHKLLLADQKPSLSLRALFAMGRDVDALAEFTILKDGLTLVNNSSAEEDAEATQKLIHAGITHLNQATFRISDDLFIRVDSIILHSKELIEVKAGSKTKEVYLFDLAFQEYLLRKISMRNSTFSLILRNSSYITGMPWSEALKKIDVTERVNALLNDEKFTGMIDSILSKSGQPPSPIFSKSCKKCTFSRDCWSHIENPSFGIPRVSDKQMAKIIELGTFDISKVPDEILTPTQLVHKHNISDNCISISKAQLSTDLENIRFPVAHLDFEAFNLPFHPAHGVKTCEMVPFQSSIHIEHICGEVSHHEYLCSHSFDDRLGLAQHLVATLADASTILTWNVSFERRMLQHLANTFPELSEELEAIILKLVDLEPIVRKNVSHFGFKGSYSLKSVAPTLCPSFDYDDLDVDNGNEANGAYSLLVRGLIPNDQISQVRTNLLKYCQRDTQATLAIHRYLRASIKEVKV